MDTLQQPAMYPKVIQQENNQQGDPKKAKNYILYDKTSTMVKVL